MDSSDTVIQTLFRQLSNLDQSDEKLRAEQELNARERTRIHDELRLLMKLENENGERQRNKRNITSTQAIAEFLTAKGGPAKTDEITRGIHILGCYVDEPTVRSNLVRHHNRGVKFVRISKNLYDLKNRKLK